MKRLLLSGVSLIAALAATSPAIAGGQWQGSYLGLSAGYGDDWARFEDDDYDWWGGSHAYYPTGFVYGIQGGHNWQDRNVVWGLELDFQGTNLDRTQQFAFDNIVKNKVNWTASIRPRGGFALGDTFIYDTAGIAIGDFTRSWIEPDESVGLPLLDTNDIWPHLGATKVGLAAGFGVEHAIGGNWSVRGEAQALRFFQNTQSNLGGYRFSVDDTIFTLKAGVNYSFGAHRDGGNQIAQGQPFDFSGAYLGLDLGGHAATIQLSDIDNDDFGGTRDLLSQGVAGGFHGGYNTQINGFLYGVEGGINFVSGRDSTNEQGSGPFNFSGANWGGDFKFKAGAAADDTLMYLTAGYAFLNYDLLRDDSDIWNLSGTHSGFTIGTGIETAFTPHFSGRIEASYSGFGGDTSASPTNSNSFRGAAQDVALTAGLNYYLGEHSMGSGALAPSNWAGLYAGADGIFAYHQGIVFDRDYDDNGGNYVLPSFGAGAGVHAGYDWQSSAFVYGVLADFAFFSNDESDTSPNYRTVSSSLNWMGTLRGRAGLATGQALFYATGGVAIADADLKYLYLPGPDISSYNFDNSRFGWTIGLGIEKAMSDNSSFKLETLYTKFGEESALTGDPTNICSNQLGSGRCVMLGYDDTITVKAGYSFRFKGM